MWADFCQRIAEGTNAKTLAKEAFSSFGVYPESIHAPKDGGVLFMARDDKEKFLVAFPETVLNGELVGRVVDLACGKARQCPLSIENSKVIRKHFPFTEPRSHKDVPVTIGLGDRLGLASPGHIRTARRYGVFPVLAQQSVRELTLTGRTFDDVLAAAVWAVFQEGFAEGYGADGDHLKTHAEVKMALDAGFTMITLDCSEQIRNDFAEAPEADIDKAYAVLPESDRVPYENAYLQKDFPLEDGVAITVSPMALKKILLVYLSAIRHAVSVYREVIIASGRDIDFEISIDETLSTTSPEAHYVVARILQEEGVRFASLAPRFCGEFQKGIDYIGDTHAFQKEFALHAQIARQLGYKVSVHSGSDKFTVFPIVGAESKGIYHLKTAGTNWLEALRVIAVRAPALFRELTCFALENLQEAKKYYHITEDTSRIPPLASLADSELPSLLDQNDARQVLHVTYGLILQAQKDGKSRFKDAIYSVLHTHETDYDEALQKHIGRHLQTLGLQEK